MKPESRYRLAIEQTQESAEQDSVTRINALADKDGDGATRKVL